MSNAQSGNRVSVHYVGTHTDGTEFDNSRKRGQPLTFTLGSGQLIPGFDQAVTGMAVGETKTITVPPENAYGVVQEGMEQVVPVAGFPDGFDFTVGGQVVGQTTEGSPIVATVVSFDDTNVTLDLNHPMAGKTLNFDIELVDIEDNTTDQNTNTSE